MDEFFGYLKKHSNENDLKYYISTKKFEEEENDLYSKAMNICFEFLGIGGGELIVTLDNTFVTELSQVIRSRQATKTMFQRSSQAIETSLRNHFNNFAT